ncbi:asparagine synthase (glutamine-hydrolyzing) [Fulvimonas sp. R45]|uniref:asparagine synthase (glutamine-hydrolyzing) n=1 Tax=Fulvimonas sp. R45 TaxID=3045937 RepID=UPI00265FECD9|nr:asparagine synthase (glutamine-hydrolyzing) [Fulvimonas sp. R45]MDO1528148.1 asparagine synthase (glutamine-hydrolyzing) [Fulvimonas sp. R45]
MCGITGIWESGASGSPQCRDQLLRAMTGALRHRGPDDAGFFADANAGIALGHRRLSIVDLSPLGHQPMMSPSGRHVIVFNGEVYNHARLRPELEKAGFAFRGHSDTEVMLAAIEHWGLEAALDRFVGMFAFALWDKQNRTLVLARDRLGIKPLYYGWGGSFFAFSSELKAFSAIPGFANQINRDALCLLLRYNYIPEPWSIWQHIYKLPPGCFLRVDAQIARTPMNVAALTSRIAHFWSARDVAEAGERERFKLSDADATAELDRLLRDAVRLRMEADVPLGAFLSGGVDSSAVTALMQVQASRPVKTFSIGFEGDDYDEAKHAKAVAKHLGTDHHELYVTARDALNVVPQLPTMFDEPFADSSQIPTFLVSKFARGTVTVALSGDGGDELFAGYNRHFWGGGLRQRLDSIPHPVRRALSGALRGQWFGRSLEHLTPMLPARFRLKNPRAKADMLVDMLGASSNEERYRLLVSQWRDPAAVVLDASEPHTMLDDPFMRAVLTDPAERMMYNDLVTYLPGDILTKVDRASMAVGLEARVPLLDHRVVEYAWRLPVQKKIRNGQGKWLLRQVLYQYVPRELIERPKQGFGGPVHQWLRGPLRDWAESLLAEDGLRREGFFDPGPIRAMWQAHLSGRADSTYRLWGVLMFQSWLRNDG